MTAKFESIDPIVWLYQHEQRFDRVRMQTCHEVAQMSTEQVEVVRSAASRVLVGYRWGDAYLDAENDRYAAPIMAAAVVFEMAQDELTSRRANAEAMRELGYERTWHDGGRVETVRLPED